MKNYGNALLSNNKLSGVLFILYVLLVSFGLYLSQKSILSFLLLLGSLLILYFLRFSNRVKWITGVAILGFLLPLVASRGSSYQSYMEVATMVGIYVAMALGLNIVVGMAGLLDLGFIAFFALGSYTYGIFTTTQAANFMPFGHYPLSGESFWLFIIIGSLVGALFGILLGIPVLRVKGDYLAIVTLGFGEIVRIVFNNLDKPVNITNGAMGISSVTPPQLFGIPIIYPGQFYFIVLVLLFIVIYMVRRLEHSKMGRAWKAVRENEIAAQAMGIPLVKTKLTAFAIGASFSGAMGVVFAAKQAFVDPTSFTYLESTTILVMVLLGGMGSVPGVILGAAIVTILNLQVLTEVTNWLNQLSMSGVFKVPDALSPAKMQRLIFGALLIVFALYRSKGLLPAKNIQYHPETLIRKKEGKAVTPLEGETNKL
ncbi:branched-chain amino acid ABC transporter permease [Heyndrickxia acidiproducens]|uniref:branched-chain amino acid ABC transporter permease n=1 Tax=Heyndrickxia acidiproducens TaxID=1121084 RepID=UPI00037DE721|nr:branched-chain amino acid ABC transporter permease [Heyndrickxia acidiproducens]